MSFDPDQVLAIRELIPQLPRGVTAETTYEQAHWPQTTPAQRRGMQHLRHAFQTQPHFVAFRVDDLPAAAPWMAHKLFACALLTWTVRTSEQRERAARYADQMIFEGFVPGT
jgi:glycerophosphoryl diester phosphodiesterase